MNNNTISNEEIKHLLDKDADEIMPDTAVQQRLEYAFLLKSSKAEVRQNSFAGMFSWLFSWAHLPLKAGIVSLVVLFSLLNIPSVENQFLAPLQDTTMQVLPYQIDSSETSPFFADTCFTGHTFKQTPKALTSGSSLISLQCVPFIQSYTSNWEVFDNRNQTVLASCSAFPPYRILRQLPQADLNTLTRYAPRRLC